MRSTEKNTQMFPDTYDICILFYEPTVCERRAKMEKKLTFY